MTALAELLPIVVLAASQPIALSSAVLRPMMPLRISGAIVLLWILTTSRYLHLAEYSFLGRSFRASFAHEVGEVLLAAEGLALWLAALLLFLTDATAWRAELFQSELGLWQDAASKSLEDARPHQMHAMLLKRIAETGKRG